jgi:hypothetical protein
MADIVTSYVLTTPGPDITFNSGTLGDSTDKYWLTAIQGLDGPAIRAPVDPVPFGDGGLIHTFWLGPRRVIFDGMLLIESSTSQADCQELRNNLAFALQNALLSIINTAGSLSWTAAGQSAVSLSVFNEVPLSITYSDNYMVSNFSFGLISADALPA